MARKIAYTGRVRPRRRIIAHTFSVREPKRIRLFSDMELFLLYISIGAIISIITFSKLLAIFAILEPLTVWIGLPGYQILIAIIISLLTSFITTAIIVEKLKFMVLKC
jgi:hypothetical protein